MIQAEYVRDMHNNYLVLKGIEGSSASYGTKMLLNNIIPGVIRVELRCIDKIDLFYYDITSKRSIYEIYENKTISYEEMKNLLSNILLTISNAGDYLLSENDFILDSKYLFIDNVTKNTELCHLAGSQENVQEQLSRLMEYLMNKVDYKEEKAVLLIYALYKESKEIDCTFQKLLKELNKNQNKNPAVKKINIESGIKSSEHKNAIHSEINEKQELYEKNESIKAVQKNDIQNRNRIRINSEKNINTEKNINAKKTINTEKNINTPKNTNIAKNKKESTNIKGLQQLIEIDNEKEIQYYGNKTYILGGTAIAGGIGAIFLALALNLLQNSFGTGLDVVKLVCFLIIVGCVEGYIFLKLFDKKYRLTRIKTEIECMDQREVDRNSQGWAYKGFGVGKEISPVINPGNDSRNNPSNDTYNNSSNAQGNNPDNIIGYNPEEAYHNSSLEEVFNNLRDDRFTNSMEFMKAESCPDTEVEAGKTQLLWQEDDYEEGKTVILTELISQTEYYLESYTEEAAKIPIINFPFIIGKAKGADYIISDVSVSRRHAQFQREGSNVYILDLHSTNGTYVNGIKLGRNKPFLLKEGDEIVFSQIKFLWKKH